MRLLLVEDAQLIREPLKHALIRAGWAVDAVGTGEEGLELAQEAAGARDASGAYDAVVLDIMLPGIDGITVLQKLRRGGFGAPVILLTARGDVGDRVRGLRAGADDYLPKPFHIEELLARLEAMCRRYGVPEPSHVLEAFGLSYLPQGRILSCRGNVCELTPKEGMLLEALMRTPGLPVMRERLEAAAWGVDGRMCGSHRLEVQISLLRARLDEVAAPARIRAVRGIGYALEEDRHDHAAETI